MTPSVDLTSLLEALVEARVEFVLVGGLAVAAHGAPRATADIDICPNPEAANLERLANLLDELGAENADADGFERDELPPHDTDGLKAGGNFRLRTRLGNLDILQYLNPFEDRTWTTLNRSAETRRPFGMPVRVCGYEELIAMKRAAGRPQDLIDIENIRAARGEL